MPNEKLKKYLNDIVWWIPFRKLRDFIRETFYTIYEIKEQNDILLKLLAQNDNLKYIIIRMSGGFADQLYLYRFGYSIEKLYNKKVLYDISWYGYNGKDDMGKYNRNFEILNIFDDFSFEVASENRISIAKGCCFIIGYRYENIDITDIIENTKFIYFDNGAWRTNIKQLDFNEVFNLDKYILPKLDSYNKSVYENIKNCKHSVACHVRRNDWLRENGKYSCYNLLLEEDYFIKAIEKISEQIKEKLKIYFFSDDIDWVKNKLIPLIKNKYDYMAVDINDNDRGYFDFYLISNCKYQIASEGRFCRTAYQFNKYKNKILITPNNIGNINHT